jgi:hypothetical protein
MWDRPFKRLMHSLALVAALVLPAGVGAHEETTDPVVSGDSMALSAADQKLVGDDVTPLEAGLYEVRVPGPNLITHGPDSERAMNLEEQRAGASGGIGFDPGDAERAPVCSSDYFQHVLYARTPSTPDRFAQVKPQIQAAIRRMDAVLNQDAIQSGGVSADYKVLCDGSGQVRVDEFTSPSSSFDDIVTAARAAGFNYANADYTIFFDGGNGACGVGSYIDDQRLTASNESNSGGGYGVSYKDCWFNETPMHENGHSEGAVQYGAPNSTGSGGHCNQGYDVMCYSPDGGDLRQGGLVVRCADRIHFDCNGDDYFNPSPPAGSYLATHWNLGSGLNRFMVFSQASPPAGGGGVGGLLTDVVGAVTGKVTALVSGRRTTAKAAPADEWQYFKVHVRPASGALEAAISGDPVADLDLYLRPRAKPSISRHTCLSTGAGSTERCRVGSPQAGVWYVGVRSTNGTGGSNFSIKVTQRR